jgi:hypothetical protein
VSGNIAADMPNQIHYEVFRRVGARGGWTLLEVVAGRDAAIKLAQAMMAEDKATGVKVVKETYNDETGDYLSLKIFEEGHNSAGLAIPAAAEDAPNALPCFKPDDLYSYHARATIARLLSDFLARNKITVTELIHRADMLEKLEATGTVYQFAIQKIAVAQAAGSTSPVQQIVKSLNELVTKACNRVYRDQRAGKFPDPLPEQFAILARQLAGQGDAPYLFNGALARHLKDAAGWDEKVLRLLTIMEDAPEEEAPRKLVLSAVDAILAEVLGGSSALRDLLGTAETLADMLRKLVDLFLGKTRPDGGEGLALLTRHFAADDLPEARTAVANRIVAEFKANKRLMPTSLVEELKALRSIANSIVLGVGKYLSHEDLVAAFTLRSERLVMPEVLGAYLDGAAPDEKIERMLFVEDNIIGAKNKRVLASFTLPLLTCAPFDNHFQNPKLALVQRLQRLAQLQSRVLRGGFIDVSKSEMAEKLDSLAAAVEARGKLFDSIRMRPTNHVEKATALIKLASQGVFTEPRLGTRARDLILGYLSQPGFLAGYLAQLPKQENAPPDTKRAMGELMADLGKAGITAEAGLKSIAA